MTKKSDILMSKLVEMEKQQTKCHGELCERVDKQIGDLKAKLEALEKTVPNKDELSKHVEKCVGEGCERIQRSVGAGRPSGVPSRDEVIRRRLLAEREAQLRGRASSEEEVEEPEFACPACGAGVDENSTECKSCKEPLKWSDE